MKMNLLIVVHLLFNIKLKHLQWLFREVVTASGLSGLKRDLENALNLTFGQP